MEKKRIRNNKSRSRSGGRRPAFGDLPAGVSSILLGVIGTVCLSLLLVLGHDILTQGRMFAAKEILVIGNRHLSYARVLSLAGIEPGANIFAINLMLARRRLLSDGWIAEARVGREIPDRLIVRVREHEPLALIELDKSYIMSREGTIIKAWDETDAFELPHITGLACSDLPLEAGVPDEPFASLMQVLQVARTHEGALSLSGLTRIDVDRGLGITLHADGPVMTARMGFAKYDEKYARVDRLLGYLNRQPTDPALEIVDLESDGRIVAGPFLRASSDSTGRRT